MTSQHSNTSSSLFFEHPPTLPVLYIPIFSFGIFDVRGQLYSRLKAIIYGTGMSNGHLSVQASNNSQSVSGGHHLMHNVQLTSTAIILYLMCSKNKPKIIKKQIESVLNKSLTRNNYTPH